MCASSGARQRSRRGGHHDGRATSQSDAETLPLGLVKRFTCE